MDNKTINTNISNDSKMKDIDFHHVDGQQKGFIQLFALSTCGWCKETRMYLEENDISYDYIYVDLTSGEERDNVLEELEKYNPELSFPTVVINNKSVIVGYEPEEMATILTLS